MNTEIINYQIIESDNNRNHEHRVEVPIYTLTREPKPQAASLPQFPEDRENQVPYMTTINTGRMEGEKLLINIINDAAINGTWRPIPVTELMHMHSPREQLDGIESAEPSIIVGIYNGEAYIIPTQQFIDSVEKKRKNSQDWEKSTLQWIPRSNFESNKGTWDENTRLDVGDGYLRISTRDQTQLSGFFEELIINRDMPLSGISANSIFSWMRDQFSGPKHS